jgi:hypothetical protein
MLELCAKMRELRGSLYKDYARHFCKLRVPHCPVAALDICNWGGGGAATATAMPGISFFWCPTIKNQKPKNAKLLQMYFTLRYFVTSNNLRFC